MQPPMGRRGGLPCAAALLHATMPVLAAPSKAQPAMAANNLACVVGLC